MVGSERHPWLAGNLIFPRRLVKRIDEEATAAYGRDEESCGLLTGPSSDPCMVNEIVPMVNRANKLHALDPETYPRTGRTYFDLDPLRFERAVSDGERHGQPVKVVYHSHLDAGAYFSETDAAAATAGGPEPTYDVAYLVTSVVGGRVDDRKLFIWSNTEEAFVETGLTIVD